MKLTSPSASDALPDVPFAGRERLVAGIERALAAGDCHAVTAPCATRCAG